jgi:DNA-binding response OmpR family regulator
MYPRILILATELTETVRAALAVLQLDYRLYSDPNLAVAFECDLVIVAASAASTLTRTIQRRRNCGCDRPLLAITATPDHAAAYSLYRAGADEIASISEPVFLLAVKISKLLFRPPHTKRLVVVGRGFKIDLLTSHTWSETSAEVHLRPRELQLFTLLVKNIDIPVSRERIAETLTDQDMYTTLEAVDVHISHIRKRFREAGSEFVIETVKWLGYRVRSAESN